MVLEAIGYGPKNWEDYFTKGQIGYLNIEEGLFVLSRFSNTTPLHYDLNYLYKPALKFLKEAVETTATYTKTELPYEEKFMKLHFGQHIINSETRKYSGLKVDSKLLKKLFTYNDYVKKGRAIILLKKRPDIAKAVLDFLDLQKNWVTYEDTFIQKTGAQLEILLNDKTFGPIDELLQKWKSLLAECHEQIDNYYEKYSKHSYAQPEAVIAVIKSYKSSKIKDLDDYVTGEFGTDQLN